MSRFKLPDGVPPDNQTGNQTSNRTGAAFSPSDKTGGAYQAPDMATPQYSKPVHEAAKHDDKTRRVMRGQFSEIVREDEGDEDIKILPARAGGIALITLIAAVLAALGAIVVMNSRQEIPLCSEQPEWNQYNCRPG